MVGPFLRQQVFLPLSRTISHLFRIEADRSNEITLQAICGLLRVCSKITSALAVLCSSIICHGQSFDEGALFTLVEENDAVADTDRHYTQGIRIAYLQADHDLPQWVARLSNRIPAYGFSTQGEKWGYEIGQNVYTPENINLPQLMVHDRPFAGWLYGGLILQRRGSNRSGQLYTQEHFGLELGIIGPESLAEQTQRLYHDLAGSHPPLGWRNQLQTEPGLALKYQRSWLFRQPLSGAWRVDLIPRAGASLGNVDTSFRLAGMLRFGWHVPDDFGIQTIDSLGMDGGGRSPSATSGRWGFYVFSGVEGRTLLYTTFLDGNIFQTSHHVDKESFVGDWKNGIVLSLDRVELGFSYVLRTREFVGQVDDDSFGSFFVKYKF